MKNLCCRRLIAGLLVLLVTISPLSFDLGQASSLDEAKTDLLSQSLPFPSVPFYPEIQTQPAASHPKMDSVLVELAQAANESEEATGKLAETRSLRIVNGMVQVQVSHPAGQAEAATAAVQKLGGNSSHPSHDGKLLQAWLPPQALLRLADEASVDYIRAPVHPVYAEEPQAVDVSSEGLSVINADDWHAAGIRGSGVKIAVVDAGFLEYTTLLGSELPLSVTIKNFVDYEADYQVNGTTEHGTAVAEIVYDIAPQASLYLVKVDTPLDLKEAVEWLITQQVDIINTSLGWFNVTPGDGTGLFADLAQLARDNDILWVTAGGNYRYLHWGGPFADMNNDSYHDYEILDGTVRFVNYFSPSLGYGTVVPAGTPISAYLRWDDWTEVMQDYNLILVRYVNIPPQGPYWTTVTSSTQVQSGLPGQTPTEYIQAIAPYTTYYGFIFQRINSTRDGNLEFFVSNPYFEIYYQEHSLSLLNLADVPAVMTTSVLDVTLPYLQEPYSSEGPTNGPGGTADGGIIKPDISAYDWVSTATYGYQGFTGTSPATAHASGAAALVKSAAYAYTPDQVQGYLQSNAIDMGTEGMDTIFGHGRLSLGDPQVFLTPPHISGLPDQFLAMNTSLPQAIDLWAYTNDPFTQDEELVFSIDNFPDANAGVSISNNRYLSITPNTGWIGQTQVSVRVTTPYMQFDNDQLEIFVLGEPEISDLPDQVLPVNGSLTPAIDLWAYSSDAFFTDDQLIFSIENLPAPGAGVSLRENRYLDITPLADWVGETTVSVRVTSPVNLSDSSAFEVHILPPVKMAELPDQYVPVNLSLVPAIDLWAYTSAVYFSDELLIFSIDNSPDPQAGVSLRDNRYIDIQPAQDWMGQTQVTVRVVSPTTQYDTESFIVNVGRYKIWNGVTNRSWETSTNWTPEGVPVFEDSVVIPYTPNQPQLSGSVAINDLITQPGALLDLGQFLLSIEGVVINRGTLQQTLPVTIGKISQFLHLTNQAGSQDRYFGIDILPSLDEPETEASQAESFSITVMVSGEQYCSFRSSGISRCYSILVSQPIKASVSFYYLENEANGLQPEDLVTYRFDTYWRQVYASYSSGNNLLAIYLTASPLYSFGSFAIDLSGRPVYPLMLPLVVRSN